jgi:hypothetical protein
MFNPYELCIAAIQATEMGSVPTKNCTTVIFSGVLKLLGWLFLLYSPHTCKQAKKVTYGFGNVVEFTSQPKRVTVFFVFSVARSVVRYTKKLCKPHKHWAFERHVC